MIWVFVFVWVFGEIFLVVIFSVLLFLCGEDFGDDFVVLLLFVCFFCYFFCGFFLFGVVVEDFWVVLGFFVGVLLVGCGGVVYLVEEGEEVGVGDFGGVVD